MRELCSSGRSAAHVTSIFLHPAEVILNVNFFCAAEMDFGNFTVHAGKILQLEVPVKKRSGS
jgi:hypothetical protein